MEKGDWKLDELETGSHRFGGDAKILEPQIEDLITSFYNTKISASRKRQKSDDNRNSQSENSITQN